MRIGLIRHFKVKHQFPNKFLVSYDEVLKWFEVYETAEIEIQNMDMIEDNWEICYSSKSYRAHKTASSIYKGEIITHNHISELDVLPLMRIRLRLPFFIWGIIVRHKSMSKNKITETFRINIESFVNEIIHSNKNEILIVSHGLAMLYLKKALKEKGLKGKNFLYPVNGILYEYRS